MTYYKLFQNIMKKNKLFALLVIMLAAATNGWAWSGGNGTASAPYEIGDETDWNDLAYLVNSGETYSGTYFRLVADISVSQMIGVANFNNVSNMELTNLSKPFCGKFDGDGHTLTVNYEVLGSDNDRNKWGIAPFRVAGDGAEFRNLHIAGSIAGAYGFAAGLIGCVMDQTSTVHITIENCRSSVSINTSSCWNPDERAYNGGFIGSTTGRGDYYSPDVLNPDPDERHYKIIKFKGCVFDGEFAGFDSGFSGFVGSNAVNVNVQFKGCVFMPSYFGLSHSDTHATFMIPREGVDDPQIYEECYYANVTGDETALNGIQLQGTPAYSITGRNGVTVEFNGYNIISGYENITQVLFYEYWDSDLGEGSFKGYKVDNTLFSTASTSLSLNLSGSDIGYSASAGTLTGSSNPYTLVMAAANTVIWNGVGFAVAARQDPMNRSDYYTTFYYQYQRFELTAGTEAYAATYNEETNNLDLIKVAGEGEVLPQNKAVLLKSNSNPIILLENPTGPSVSVPYTNAFSGTETDKTQNLDPDHCYYVFSAKDGIIGFYLYDPNAILHAHKAYVVLQSSGHAAAPRRLSLNFGGDTTTDITNVQDDKVQDDKVQNGKIIENGVLYIIHNGVRYNAQGQKVK